MGIKHAISERHYFSKNGTLEYRILLNYNKTRDDAVLIDIDKEGDIILTKRCNILEERRYIIEFVHSFIMHGNDKYTEIEIDSLQPWRIELINKAISNTLHIE